jgi:hypothetical protein
MLEKELKWNKKNAEMEFEQDYIKFLNALYSGKANINNKNENRNASIILKPFEELSLIIPHTELHESKSLGTPRVSNRVGMSAPMPFFKRSRIYTSTGESHSNTGAVYNLREVDTGTLILTNQRLVFTGRLKTLNMDLKKVLNVDLYTNAIQINLENKQKTEYFMNGDLNNGSVNINFKVNNRRRSISLNGEIMGNAVLGKINQLNNSQD